MQDISPEKKISTTESESENSTIETTKPKQPPKPPKLEDKPFQDFVKNHLIPELISSLTHKGQSIDTIVLKNEERPIVGGNCWLLYGEFDNGRRFWLTFSSEDIKSTKNIVLAESSVEPSVLESFLIDEKKITLQLLTSRFLQRLNGQKWFGNN